MMIVLSFRGRGGARSVFVRRAVAKQKKIAQFILKVSETNVLLIFFAFWSIGGVTHILDAADKRTRGRQSGDTSATPCGSLGNVIWEKERYGKGHTIHDCALFLCHPEQEEQARNPQSSASVTPDLTFCLFQIAIDRRCPYCHSKMMHCNVSLLPALVP